jgi:ATF/CREB family transcription factor
MLTGPTGASDYFDTSFSRGFPTPNESGLRTGLTPGGGGSMFPAPSPNSQALFNSLQSGGATPSTLDFYRTSMASKAATQNTNFGGPTSQPTDPNLQQNMDRSQQQNQPDAYQQQQQQHADADAVNGLYMLAQANNGIRNNNNYPVANQAPSVQTNVAPMQSSMPSQNTSPVAKRAANNSIGGMSSMSADTAEFSDSGQSEQAKPTTRSRGKKATGKAATGNGRRKADDTPAKTPASKRAKGNNGSVNTAMSMDGMDGMDDMSDDEGPQVDANGKKMTDEEKRKNFLERNR